MIFNRGGMVFLMSLAVMTILMGFGLSYLYVARTEMLISSNEIQALRTFYLAEAGVEHAMANLLYGSVPYQYSIVNDVLLTDSEGNNTLSYKAYMPDYPASKTIVSEAQSHSLIRKISFKINDSGFTDAMMAAGNSFTFKLTTAKSVGQINGNVKAALASLTIDERLNGVEVVGKANYVPSLVAPVLSAEALPYYKANATNYPGGTTWVTDVGNNSADIHYINGDLNISGAGLDKDVVIKGTVVVDGKLTIGSPQTFTNKSLTILPDPGKPALIVKNEIMASAIAGSSFVFDGLVYTGQYMYAYTFISMTIKGALISQGVPNGLSIQKGPLYINYDPDMDPGYCGSQRCFTGTIGSTVGKPVIVSWKGLTS